MNRSVLVFTDLYLICAFLLLALVLIIGSSVANSNVVVALEIAIEAFEELSDTAISIIEDTLVLQEKGTMT